MFVPRPYRAKSVEDVKVFVQKYAFASLVGSIDGRPIATHTLLFLTRENDKDYLVGHIARINEQCQCFDGKQKLLAIFQNHHSYISSSWYEKMSVPTWNYIAVHITGAAQAMSDMETRELMQHMVSTYESGQADPFKLDQLPAEQYEGLLKGIVAFKMKIDTIEAAYKLSQNKKPNELRNIITELRKTTDPLSHLIADEMESNLQEK